MRKHFITKLTEAAISTTDLALNVESMSEQIQSMIEKITNIKTKDLAVLVKKIKYDNEIAMADEFNQNIGGKLDQLIQSMTEIKGEIDNVTVGMLNGDDNLGGSSEGEDDLGDLGDFESDFGADLEGSEMPSGEEASDTSAPSSLDDMMSDLTADLDSNELGREMK
jgi:hypothetical protein